jgi:hypothetical protein
MRAIGTLSLLGVMLMASAPGAASISISGTRQNVNFLNPPGTGRCAPLNTVNISPNGPSSSGTSNFGNFVYTQSHCIAGPPGPSNPFREVTDGQFLWEFAAGDTLSGTYTGEVVFSNGVISGTEFLTVLGGTGSFFGATGGITNIGTLQIGSFESRPAGFFSGTFDGQITVPAVPEPATWGMMILGFGIVGAATRRRRKTVGQAG